MNRTITSKDTILNAAKKTAYTKGLYSVNIRDTAKDCGISVGSVYNYFPSKTDLIAAVIEDFWKNIFHKNDFSLPKSSDFIDAFQIVYTNLYQSLKQFEQGLLKEIAALGEQEKSKGREIQSVYWTHIKKGLLKILSSDKRVSQNVWTKDFTKELFINFVFSNMMAMLKEGQTQCGILIEIMRRILYPV